MRKIINRQNFNTIEIDYTVPDIFEFGNLAITALILGMLIALCIYLGVYYA